MIEIIGWIGSILFLGSWLVQIVESEKNGRFIFTAKFFWLRAIGCIMLIVESIRVWSLPLLAMNGVSAAMQFYNYKFLKKEI